MTPSEQDLAWIVERVLINYPAESIYLFGSAARGSQGDGSDLDLLVVGPSRVPRAQRGRHVAAALNAFPSKFDVLFYTREELADELRRPTSFAATILADARLLHGSPVA